MAAHTIATSACRCGRQQPKGRCSAPREGAALFRRAMLEAVAVEGRAFDPSFFMYFEDVDLAWRARLAGWKSWFVPQAVVHHRFQAHEPAAGRRLRTGPLHAEPRALPSQEREPRVPPAYAASIRGRLPLALRSAGRPDPGALAAGGLGRDPAAPSGVALGDAPACRRGGGMGAAREPPETAAPAVARRRRQRDQFPLDREGAGGVQWAWDRSGTSGVAVRSDSFRTRWRLKTWATRHRRYECADEHG